MNRFCPPKFAAGVAVVLLLAGAVSCSSSPKRSKGSDVLHTAFYANMAVPDPDVFYEAEGLQVMMSVYDGLLQYDPAGPTLGANIVGAIADTWKTSSDALTYSFHIRSAARFADGKPVTSADLLYSFQRRSALGQGPAYMLGDVASYDTASPADFVIHLKRRNADFLGYLASPYSPKAVQAEVVKAHTTDAKDNGQEWLKSHSAGAGPFQISQFVPSDHYTLTRNDHYWGGRPALREIDISIVPDQTAAVLQLQRKELDVIHNVTPQTLNQYKDRSGFQTIFVPAVQLQDVHINPQKPPFDDQGVRTAFRNAIDLQKIVPEVWGAQGSPAKQMVPPSELPEGLATQVWQPDPTGLKAAAGRLPASSKNVVIVYQTGLLGDQHLSEALQSILTTAGFRASVRPIPISELFQYRDAPQSKVPNIVIELENPDTTSATNFADIYYRTDAFLNFVRGGSKDVDGLLDQAKATTDTASYQRLAGQALDVLFQRGDFILPASVQGVFITSSCLKDVSRNAVAPYFLNLSRASLQC